MPVYPTPGKGISTAGLDKDDGWGSRNAAGAIIDFAHAGDQGIDHYSGLWKGGLDTQNNPKVTTRTVTAITDTGATINWTTQTSQPPGTVRRRVAGAANAAWTNPQTEAAGNKTTHAIVMTGLTVNTPYEYQITQPPLNATAGTVEIIGSFRTALTMEDPGMQGVQGEQMGPPILNPDVHGLRDTSRITDSQDLIRKVGPEQEQLPPAFKMNNLQAADEGPTGVTVTWRTEVYADGTVMYRPVGGEATTVDEIGVKRLNHSVTLSDLKPDTEYEIAVISADAQGNTADAGPIRVKTPAE